MKLERRRLIILAIVLLGVSLTLGDAILRKKFIGSGEGYNGSIKTQVILRGEKIIKINILEEHDTPGIKEKAIEGIKDMVLKEQTVAVDTIAGATHTSLGLKNSIYNALKDKGMKKFLVTKEDEEKYLKESDDSYGDED